MPNRCGASFPLLSLSALIVGGAFLYQNTRRTDTLDTAARTATRYVPMGVHCEAQLAIEHVDIEDVVEGGKTTWKEWVVRWLEDCVGEPIVSECRRYSGGAIPVRDDESSSM